MHAQSFRLPLYYILWLFSVILLGLTAARLNYTTHLPHGDPLNRGRDFFDPIVAELLVCSLLALGFAPFVTRVVHRVLQHPVLDSTNPFIEIAALSVLWLLWLVGAAHATSIWPDLSFCSQLGPCQVLSAMMAFAWLGWLTVCALLALCLVPVVRNALKGRALGNEGASSHGKDLPPVPV